METAAARRFLLVGAILAISVTAIIAIVALLVGDFADTELRVLATTGGFGLSSLIAMRGTALLDQRRHIALGRAVISLSALSFLIELWILWVDDDNELAWKSYVCAITTAVAFAQIAGMLSRRRATDPVWIPRLVSAAGTAAVVAAAMSWAAAIGEISRAGYYRVLGAVVVLNVFLAILQPVLRRLGRPAVEAGGSSRRFVLVLADGSRVDQEGADLPNAVARALREAEQSGRRVTRIELEDG
jgi:hypothetical protein